MLITYCIPVYVLGKICLLIIPGEFEIVSYVCILQSKDGLTYFWSFKHRTYTIWIFWFLSYLTNTCYNFSTHFIGKSFLNTFNYWRNPDQTLGLLILSSMLYPWFFPTTPLVLRSKLGHASHPFYLSLLFPSLNFIPFSVIISWFISVIFTDVILFSSILVHPL